MTTTRWASNAYHSEEVKPLLVRVDKVPALDYSNKEDSPNEPPDVCERSAANSATWNQG